MKNDLGYLRILSGDRRGEKFPVRDGLLFGRDQRCDICIADASVSRNHFKINVKGEVVEIVDLESKNGTKVNGRLVSRAILNSGDRIEIGETVLIYEGVPNKKRKISRRLLVYISLLVIITFALYFLVESNKNRKNQKLHEYTSRGREYFQQGKFDEALAQYRYALQLAPNNESILKNIEMIERKKLANIQLERAKKFYDEGKLDLAENEIKNLLEKDPENKEALNLSDLITKNRNFLAKLNTVESLKNKGDFDSAISILKELYSQSYDQQVKSMLIATLIARGFDLEKKGNRREALNVFNEVLSLDALNYEAKSAIERIQSFITEKPTTELKQKFKSRLGKKEEKEPPATSDKKASVGKLTEEQKREAEEIYWEGYQVLKDEKDPIKAKALFLRVLEIAPDPNFEFYQRAKRQLQKLQ